MTDPMTDPDAAPTLPTHLVAEAEQTCAAAPEQWSGRFLGPGLHFYFRLRWGVASLSVGRNHADVEGNQDVRVPYGDKLTGVFEHNADRHRVFTELCAMHPLLGDQLDRLADMLKLARRHGCPLCGCGAATPPPSTALYPVSPGPADLHPGA